MTNCRRVTLWLLLWVRSAHDAPSAAITAKVASHGETAAACIELDTPAPAPVLINVLKCPLIPQPDFAGTKAAPAADGRGVLPLDTSMKTHENETAVAEDEAEEDEQQQHSSICGQDKSLTLTATSANAPGGISTTTGVFGHEGDTNLGDQIVSEEGTRLGVSLRAVRL